QTRQHLAYMGLGLGDGGVRRETVVERHPCPVGDHVAGDAARDGDSVEALAVLESVDHGAAGPVGGEPLEDRGQVVDGVVADPVTAGVGGDPAGGDVELHGALAASLDPGGGRFPRIAKSPTRYSGCSAAIRVRELSAAATSSWS